MTKTERFRWGITANFIVEELLLAVMIAGVLNKRNATGLWRVLYIQVCSRPFRTSDFPSFTYTTLSGTFLDFCCLFVGGPTFCMPFLLFSQCTPFDARVVRYLVG